LSVSLSFAVYVLVINKRMIHLRRAYDDASSHDGIRILVERLWPRGVSKARAKIDVWVKEVAPSTELRQWFHHDPDKWTEFRRRYRAELKRAGDVLTLLKLLSERENVTFVFAAHDLERNSAVVLKEYLESR
jgi:uncharacterized protein YeaO (DUF488 family)